MKKILAAIFTALLVFSAASGQLSGPLSGTLGPGTFNVVSDISVQNGDSLIIAPGTALLFNGAYEFDVNGYIYAVGTENDSVKFRPNAGTPYWAGIAFNDSADDSSRLGYCLITGGYAVGSWPDDCGGGILCYYSSPIISNCAISLNSSGSTVYGGGGISCFYSGSTVENCVIEGNTAENGYGGGIYCYSCSLTIANCDINGNRVGSKRGGGIYLYYSDSAIENSTIDSNFASSGGGICCLRSDPTIENCSVSGNSAYNGGGIHLAGSSPNISNCTISGNSISGLQSSGGGIFCYHYSDPTISHCAVTGNLTTGDYSKGGGIFCSWYCGPTISSCVFNGNSADGTDANGGGICCISRIDLVLENCTVSGNSASANGGGICCYASVSRLTIVNTILEGNTGNGGVYFYDTLYTSIAYSDFYNNQYGNFTGSPPPNLGQITSVNNNGDSCDVFYNIFLDPLFIDSTDFHLQADSPCIDAGDPNSPLDPDSTIADIGAYYFVHNYPLITLTPHNPPIRIPAGGGFFVYNAAIRNPSADPIHFDAWTEVILPNGSAYGPFIVRTNLLIPPETTLMRQLTQFVPGNAPSGNFTYIGNAGIYPDSITSSDSFPFIKLAGDNVSNHNRNWALDGWFDDTESSSILNSQFLILNSSPNPFNAATALSFKLPDASQIKLAVYDIMGREVAALAEGWYPAGAHYAEWDASAMASGVYFARLEAKSTVQIRKLLLLK